MWDKQAIANHLQAAKLICQIKDQAGEFIVNHPQCSEYDVTRLILQQFKDYRLRTDEPPMVAFRENTNRIHYQSTTNKAKRLTKNSLIMIDLWAGLKQKNSPFADITWMYFYGKNPSQKIQRVFQIVKSSQSRTIKFIKQSLSQRQLPVGQSIHQYLKKLINETDFKQNRNNYTGHSIGFTSSHGIYGNLNQGSSQRLQPNLGYTLEPEIDLPDFGIRLELNFYIDNDFKCKITTDKQEELTYLWPKHLHNPATSTTKMLESNKHYVR